MTNIDDWKPEVGMEVLIFPKSKHDLRSPKKGKIKKVGLKYFYVDIRRFDVETKEEDNGDYLSQSHVYRTKVDHIRAIKLRNKRCEIERNLHKLTDEQVTQVYEWITPNTPQ